MENSDLKKARPEAAAIATVFKHKKYLAVLWLVPALLSTNSFYLNAISKGEEASWWNIFLTQFLVWALWAAITPIIHHLGRKFRIELPNWLRGFCIHLFLSVILVLAYLFAYTWIFGFVTDMEFTVNRFVGTYLGIFINLFHWDFLIYWLVLGIGYAFDYYEKYRLGEIEAIALEKALVQAQLKTLQSQLNPHFLFNTLHTIGGLIRHDKKTVAVEMIAGLSELLRTSLDKADKQSVSLKEELAIVERYLAIQKIRFEDRLKVEMLIAPETLSAEVPIFILQPVVENAIVHGFDKLRSAEQLTISSAIDGHDLKLTIYNDGPVLANDWQLSQQNNVGLSNTVQRLRQIYGRAAHLKMRNRGDTGVEAVITIPFETFVE